MTLPAKNILGNLSVLRDDFATAIEDQRDQVAFLGTLWEPATAYVHPCATIGSDGQRYYSMQSSTGQDPTTDTTNSYWVLELEHGSNANGEYVKLYDGTMFCTTDPIEVVDINISIGQMYRSGSVLWTFPSEFVSSPEIIRNTVGLTYGSAVMGINNTSELLCSSAIVYPEQVNGTFFITLTAIGSWY